MLEPYPKDDGFSASWEAMGVGAPTLAALAKLCAEAVAREPCCVNDALEGLSIEAKAILHTARASGVIEVKGVGRKEGPADDADPRDAQVEKYYAEKNNSRLHPFCRLHPFTVCTTS